MFIDTVDIEVVPSVRALLVLLRKFGGQALQAIKNRFQCHEHTLLVVRDTSRGYSPALLKASRSSSLICSTVRGSKFRFRFNRLTSSTVSPPSRNSLPRFGPRTLSWKLAGCRLSHS